MTLDQQSPSSEHVAPTLGTVMIAHLQREYRLGRLTREEMREHFATTDKFLTGQCETWSQLTGSTAVVSDLILSLRRHKHTLTTEEYQRCCATLGFMVGAHAAQRLLTMPLPTAFGIEAESTPRPVRRTISTYDLTPRQLARLPRDETVAGTDVVRFVTHLMSTNAVSIDVGKMLRIGLQSVLGAERMRTPLVSLDLEALLTPTADRRTARRQASGARSLRLYGRHFPGPFAQRLRAQTSLALPAPGRPGTVGAALFFVNDEDLMNRVSPQEASRMLKGTDRTFTAMGIDQYQQLRVEPALRMVKAWSDEAGRSEAEYQDVVGACEAIDSYADTLRPVLRFGTQSLTSALNP